MLLLIMTKALLIQNFVKIPQGQNLPKGKEHLLWGYSDVVREILLINALIYTLRKQNPLQIDICKGLFVVDRGIEPLCQD